MFYVELTEVWKSSGFSGCVAAGGPLALQQRMAVACFSASFMTVLVAVRGFRERDCSRGAWQPERKLICRVSVGGLESSLVGALRIGVAPFLLGLPGYFCPVQPLSLSEALSSAHRTAGELRLGM